MCSQKNIFSGNLSKIYNKLATLKVKFLNQNYSEIIITLILWMKFYITFIIIFFSYSFFLVNDFYVPHSLVEFSNSIWGGFLFFSLVLSIVLSYFYSGYSEIQNIIKIHSNKISLSNFPFVIIVFTCKPPILHTRSEFTFFLKNFQPLSIDISPDTNTIFIILFGKDDSTFDVKTRECFNQLNSFYSEVSKFSNDELTEFIIDGIHSNSHGNFYDFEDFKQNLLNGKYIKGKFNIQNNINDKILSEKNEETFSTRFTLFLIGREKSNNIFNQNSPHFFRGVKISISKENQEKNYGLYVSIKKDFLKNAILSILRIPEVNTPSFPREELEKIYFFLIHKFFNYFFREFDHSKTILPNDHNFQINLIDDNKKNFSDQKDKKELVLDQIPLVITSDLPDSTFKKKFSISKQKFDLNNSIIESELIDLSSISFQYTYFCQLFCPNMTNEFKNKSIETKKIFSVPKTCFNHITNSNLVLNQFETNLDAKNTKFTIFTSKNLKNEFLQFVNSKNMKLIDKICLFSSIILFEQNDPNICENEILEFIHSLKEDYFIR
jgi:hypothetical protein